MSETSSGNFTPLPVKADDANLRAMALICYALLLATYVTGITAVVAVIVAYINRGDSEGTVWRSHFRNTIVVFWVIVTIFLLGFLTWPIALGLFAAEYFAWPWASAFSLPLLFWMVIFPVALLWSLYRIIRGLIRASESRAF